MKMEQKEAKLQVRELESIKYKWATGGKTQILLRKRFESILIKN